MHRHHRTSYALAGAILILLALVMLGASLVSGASWKVQLGYPSYHWTTAGIIIIDFLVIRRYGLLSIPTVLMVLVSYPAFAPGYAKILFGVNDYSWVSRALQLDVDIESYALLMVFLALVTSIVTLEITVNMLRGRRVVDEVARAEVFLGMKWYVVSSVLVLVFSYVSEPGPSLISADYSSVLQGRLANTQFADGIIIVCWVIAFLNYRKRGKGKLFLFATMISFLWLFGHAKRGPLLGMSFVLVLHLAIDKRSKLSALWIGAVIFFLLAVIGIIRSDPLNEGQIVERLIESMLNRNSGIASLPGGASNVFTTLPGSIILIDRLGQELLMGKTYVDYFLRLIPTNIWLLISAPPRTYNQFYRQFFPYNGGMYIFSPAYVNFGSAGVLVVGGLLGWLIGISHVFWASRSTLRQAVSILIISFFPLAIWYEASVVIKSIVYLGVIHALLNTWLKFHYNIEPAHIRQQPVS